MVTVSVAGRDGRSVAEEEVGDLGGCRVVEPVVELFPGDGVLGVLGCGAEHVWAVVVGAFEASRG